MEKTNKLIIIGAGPAGLTAALYAARANLKPILIEGKNPGGQLMTTTYVENWPGEKKILGPTLMMNLIDQVKSTDTTFISQTVTKVDFSQKPFCVWTDNEELKSEAVIIATGAKAKRLNCPGEEEYWGKGISTCAVCDGILYRDQPIVIVGGGDSAMEEASFMSKYTSNITVVQIHDHLTASCSMQQRVLNNPNIKILYNSSILEISGNEKVEKVVIQNNKTKKEAILATKAIFVAIGSYPNTKVFKDQLELDPKGYIKLVNKTETSIHGIFAAGDVADNKYRQAITAAGAGCMATLDVEKFLTTT